MLAVMAFTTTQLTVKALRVLELIWDVARETPLARDDALRFVLAYLFSRSDGRERWLFDQFWRAATRQPPDGIDTYAERLGRSYEMTAAMNGIYRAVGVERTVEMMACRRRAAAPRAITPPAAPPEAGS